MIVYLDVKESVKKGTVFKILFFSCFGLHRIMTGVGEMRFIVCFVWSMNGKVLHTGWSYGFVP